MHYVHHHIGSHPIVRVAGSHLDAHGIEAGSIMEAFVPVEAPCEEEACKRAVMWHSDSGVAIESEDQMWKCDDLGRRVTFKATKVLVITQAELDFFLSVTQGVSAALVVGRS